MTASTRTPPLDEAAFAALYQRLRRVPAWGPADRRGALNYLTPAQVQAAAGEVRLGRSVSLAAPIETGLTPDQPEPAIHDMTGPTGDQADPDGLTFAQDRLAINVHGNADSHMDALCHAMYRKQLYNGVPAEAVTARGAEELSIEVARDGIAGRGVLLDIPRLHEVPWLEPGDLVTADDLVRAADAQRVSVGPGDLLFVQVPSTIRSLMNSARWPPDPRGRPGPAAGWPGGIGGRGRRSRRSSRAATLPGRRSPLGRWRVS